MSAQDNVTLMRNLADAYNAQDLDRLASFATENCELIVFTSWSACFLKKLYM